MKILVVDVGGTWVKMLVSGKSRPQRFRSAPDLTPDAFVARVYETIGGWKFDVVSLGYPGVVGPKGPLAEPGNLGAGWVGFDFEAAFRCPVRIANDASLQALGGYGGGKMLFLGLGTGLGSTLVAERVVVPLELGGIPHSSGQPLCDRLGQKGLDRNGRTVWQRDLQDSVETFRKAFVADYVLLGGGNARRVDPLPHATRRGGNADAFVGGFRLWEHTVEPHDRPPSDAWRVVR
jgi:polyphosphate glucokinase